MVSFLCLTYTESLITVEWMFLSFLIKKNNNHFLTLLTFSFFIYFRSSIFIVSTHFPLSFVSSRLLFLDCFLCWCDTLNTICDLLHSFYFTFVINYIFLFILYSAAFRSFQQNSFCLWFFFIWFEIFSLLFLFYLLFDLRCGGVINNGQNIARNLMNKSSEVKLKENRHEKQVSCLWFIDWFGICCSVVIDRIRNSMFKYLALDLIAQKMVLKAFIWNGF